MQRNEINILIVEDDVTLGRALKEGVTRAGYRAIHVLKPDDAIAQAKLQTIHLAVIDCMLPKMNGRDLTKALRKDIAPQLPVILMSGIYRDKAFAREAMQQTGAIFYLVKPFELDVLLGHIEKTLESVVDALLAPLQELMLKPEINHKARIRAINDTGDVQSFELISIFNLLLHPRIMGHLNIISADGQVCGVGFKGGRIVQVNQNDTQSYFGVLMVESGFISQEQIDYVMKQGGKSKKMGERLLEAGVISPHAITVVMSEQQGIRLGKIISETSVKVNFIESEELREDAVIDHESFLELLNEWLITKVTVDWLKAYYTPWMVFSLKPGPEYRPDHPVLNLHVVQRVAGLAKKLVESETLESAFAEFKLPDGLLYPALHALVSTRVLIFGEQQVVRNFDSHRTRLVRLNEDLAKLGYFERLGLSSKARDIEVRRAFHELAKMLHPDKLGPDTPADVREITREVFSRLSIAYETLSDSGKRAEYLIEMEKGRADAILKAESETEEARQLLRRGDVSLARERLEAAIALAPPTIELRLLHMWSQIKSPGADKNPSIIELVRDGLTKVPPEDRYSSLYHFVRGLHFRLNHDLDAAQKSFEQAVSLDSDFIDARRELAALKGARGQSDKPVDLLRGDLKDVVGLLFKKKR